MGSGSASTLAGRNFTWHGRLPGKGWHMLEFQLAEARGARHVLLHVDCGEGFDPALSVTLPLRRGKTAKRICYFPARARALEFEIVDLSSAGAEDLHSAPGFEVAHCCLAWLAPFFARNRLCQRLANMHRNYRGKSAREVRRILSSEARATNRSWRSVALAQYGETFHKRCPDQGYREWLAQVEPEALPSGGELEDLLESGLPLPCFALHLDLSGEPVDQGMEAVRSLLNQSYPHWALLVSSTHEHRDAISGRLAEICEGDRRVSITGRAADVTALLDHASTLEGGDFVLVGSLPLGGRLSPQALHCMARAIDEDVQLVYADSDRVDAKGERQSPLFKPGWNPDLLLSYNYIGNPCFFSASLARELGPTLLKDLDYSTYRWLLRCRGRLDGEVVVHVPKVIYHAGLLTESDMVSRRENERVLLSEYLEHECPQVSLPDLCLEQAEDFCPVTQLLPNRFRWSIPEPAPLVSLLVPTRDGIDYLRVCVDSILERTRYENFELLILDNQSSCAETLTYLKLIEKNPRVRVYRWNRPFNYSAINNFGARHARGELLGLINNDIEVIGADWLGEMVSHACRPEIGCVGAKLYYGNGTVQHGGVILGIGGTAGHSHKYARPDDVGYMARLKAVQNLSAVTGACLVLRKSVFEEVGGLNEKDLAVAYNDVDLCLRVREAGYRNLWTPYAELYHHESLTRGADDTASKRRRAQREADYMRRRWGHLLDSDPAYNPNLTLVHEDFSLK